MSPVDSDYLSKPIVHETPDNRSSTFNSGEISARMGSCAWRSLPHWHRGNCCSGNSLDCNETVSVSIIFFFFKQSCLEPQATVPSSLSNHVIFPSIVFNFSLQIFVQHLFYLVSVVLSRAFHRVKSESLVSGSAWWLTVVLMFKSGLCWKTNVFCMRILCATKNYVFSYIWIHFLYGSNHFLCIYCEKYFASLTPLFCFNF